jgi:hypothetical protein
MTNQSYTLLSIRQVIDQYCPQIINLISTLNIKRDGAIDEPSQTLFSSMVDIDTFRIMVEAQRVADIAIPNIVKNLTIDGGFSYKSCGTIDAFAHKGQQYKTSPDGLHRLIKAYLCGVTKIPIVVQDEHAKNATIEDIISREKQFFDNKNVRCAKVGSGAVLHTDKLCGKLKPEDKLLDERLASGGVSLGALGVTNPKEAFVNLPNNSSSELRKFLVVNNNLNFWDDKDPAKFGRVVKEVFVDSDIFSVQELPAQIFTAIVKIVGDICIDEYRKKMFFNWLKYQDKGGFDYFDGRWWNTLVQHSRGTETCLHRMLIAFNEWHRNLFVDNIIKIDEIKTLPDMGIEHQHFVKNCLVRNEPMSVHTVTYDMLNDIEEEEVSDALEELLAELR